MCYQIRDFTATALIRSMLLFSTKSLFWRLSPCNTGMQTCLLSSPSTVSKRLLSKHFALQKYIYPYFRGGTAHWIEYELAQDGRENQCTAGQGIQIHDPEGLGMLWEFPVVV